MGRWLTVFALLMAVSISKQQGDPEEEAAACSALLAELRQPCECSAETIQEDVGNEPELQIDLNCDYIVFGSDFPVLSYAAPLRSYSQRFAGYQALPTQAFAGRAIPLAILDFSNNSLRRLTERSLDGVRGSLRELILSDNLLGDTLNPIFASGELHGLTNLQLLDLRGNNLRALEEGFLKGCPSLQELLLDRNALTAIPSASLNGPRALRAITLSSNDIGTIRRDAFWAQPRLELLDLSSNSLSVIEGGALSGLGRLRALRLARNRLTRLNSDIFQGAENMEVLDLSENFLGDFPNVALKTLPRMRALNLSANLIQTLNNGDVAAHTNLEVLDLSRNALASLAPGTFVGLRKLRRLFLNVNSLRSVEDDAFEGLERLELLSLEDNTVLLVPTSALGRLPRLASLQLGYNRVAAVNEALLKPASNVQALSLQYNVIRELPTSAFNNFSRLARLDLSGNQLQALPPSTFAGVAGTLEELMVADNRIVSLSALALPALRRLSLARNYLAEVEPGALRLLPALEELDLSGNPRLLTLPQAPFAGLGRLTSLDLSNTGITQLTPGLVVGLGALSRVSFKNCRIGDLQERSFSVLPNLDTIDLSGNQIAALRPGSFDNVPSLRALNLSRNKLTAFKGDAFRRPGNQTSALEDLDLSDNELTYLFPSSFATHPRLTSLKVPGNRFTFFPAELLAGLRRLQVLNLSRNQLTAVDELDLASLPRLRQVDFSHNKIEQVSEASFRNSSQIQAIDLSHNRLTRLEDRTFEGMHRLDLNLASNMLSELPETIFERSKIHMLENIDLSDNKFEVAPLKALQRQYFYLTLVNLARNNLRELPSEDNMLVNIKRLDVSHNPLSAESLKALLEEPKTARELNLASTGLTQLPDTLETPFLKTLNVSSNKLTSIPPTTFHRATLLEVLDISNNSLGRLALPQLPNLKKLDASLNPVEVISPRDLSGCANLRQLRLCDLMRLTRLEASALQPLSNLEELEAHGFPRLGYLDVKGMLSQLPPLQRLDVEVKDAALSDQLAAARHPRMRELGLRGPRVQQVASSALLAGMTAPSLTVRLRETALTSLPPSLLLPVPRSTHLALDVGGSQLGTLAPPLLAALDSRKSRLQLDGLENNPISCDCHAVQFRRWLLVTRRLNVTCFQPADLQGRPITSLPEEELTCGPRSTRPPSPPPTLPPSTTTTTTQSTTEPEIIWSVAPTSERVPEPTIKSIKSAGSNSGNTMHQGNDDTLIIAIVGGVVAFIALLIIIICIARCRMSSASRYRGGPLAAPPMLPLPPACTCVKPPPSSIYMTAPSAAYSAKLAQQAMAAGYAPSGGQPYFIGYDDQQSMHMEMRSERGGGNYH